MLSDKIDTALTGRVILAGASVRSLAESARQAGLKPVCIDMFGDADLAGHNGHPAVRTHRIQSFEQLPELLHNLDHRIPLVWTGGLENAPEIVDRIAATRPVTGCPGKVLRQVRDPFRLQSALKQAGCSAPPVRTATAAVRSNDWLLKPRQGAGGIGIMRSDRCAHRLTPGDSHFLQKFVRGLPVSATFVASAASVQFVGACLQLVGERALGASGFQFCGNFGPLTLTGDLGGRVIHCGHEIARAFGVRGCFGIDLVVDDGVPHVVEVNPRITASHDIIELTSEWQWNAVRAQLDASFSESAASGQCFPSGSWQHGRTRAVSRNHNPEESAQGAGPTVKASAGLLTADRGTTRHSAAVCRMILYALHDTVISADLSARLLAASLAARARHAAVTSRRAPSRTAWLADIPPESTVGTGMPLCSIYLHSDRGGGAALHQPAPFCTDRQLLSELWTGTEINFTELFRHYERLSQTLQTDHNPAGRTPVAAPGNSSDNGLQS